MTTKKKSAPKMKAKYFHIRSTPTADMKVALPRGRGAEAARGTSSYISRSISATDVAVMKKTPYTNPVVGAGVVTAAAANAVIADSGPLPAGVYYVEITMSVSGVAAAGKHLQVEHRNAANSATNAVKGGLPYPGATQSWVERVVVALNERIRIVQSSVAGAASEVAIGHVACYLLPV